MNAIELPHGSLIYFGKEIVKVDYANKFTIQFFQIEKGYKKPAFAPNIDKHFNPIPITEDWLVKFGFELLGKYVYCLELIKNNSLLINMKHKFCFIGIRDYDDYDREIIFPDYIHQLQNIYFALTGNELTLK